MKPQEIEQMQHRQTYQNVWHVDLMSTMSADCAYCCFAMWCPPCVSYQLRRRALYGDMTRYVCCGGYMPCSGKFKEKDCPEMCLCMETCCCFVTSVMSTRWLLQDEFRIQTTKCDNCLIAFMFIIQQISCICSLLACLTGSDELRDIAECLRCVADTVTCTVTTWMQTQHKIEMDKRDGLIDFDKTKTMGVPPIQQMSREPPKPFPVHGIPGQPVAAYPAHPPYPHVYPPTPAGYPGPMGYPPPYYPPPPPPPPHGGPHDQTGLPPHMLAPQEPYPPPPILGPPPHTYNPEPPSASASAPPVLGPGNAPSPQKMK